MAPISSHYTLKNFNGLDPSLSAFIYDASSSRLTFFVKFVRERRHHSDVKELTILIKKPSPCSGKRLTHSTPSPRVHPKSARLKVGSEKLRSQLIELPLGLQGVTVKGIEPGITFGIEPGVSMIAPVLTLLDVGLYAIVSSEVTSLRFNATEPLFCSVPVNQFPE